MTQIVKALEDAIYCSDDYIITLLLSWCHFLARSSHLSQLRKVGTFTAFSLCEPLVKSMARNRQQMAIIQKRLENLLQKEEQRASKSSKSKSNKSKKSKKSKESEESAAVKAAKENIQEFQGKIDNLTNHTKWCFDEIGAYKANDRNEDIRCMVLEQIVKWINLDPSTDSFLNRHYWQYLAYGLKDKLSATVRKTTLLQLQDLFDYQCKFHGKKGTSSKSKAKSPKKKTVQRDDDGNIIEEKDEDKLDETRIRILDPFWERIRPTVNVLLKDQVFGVMNGESMKFGVFIMNQNVL